MAKTITYCFIVFVLFFSGIYRHDVDVEEYLKLAQQPQFNCVGQIFIDDKPGASCVLINKRFALTAAHGLFRAEESSATDTIIDGVKMVIYSESDPFLVQSADVYLKFGDQVFQIKRMDVHPNYMLEETKGTCDIAIIELLEPAIGIPIPKLNDKTDELNSFVYGVGYGASGPANRPDLVEQENKKIAGHNVIDSIGGYELNGTKTLLFVDFDHPTDTTCCNRMGSPTPKPLEFITTGGDSGGGLFRNINDEWELVGITAGGGIELEQFMKSFYYGQIGSWTRVSALNEWISEIINKN